MSGVLAELGLKRAISASVDYCVIGAGIVGLATARELQNRFSNARVAVLERSSAVGTSQTSHNSGVIHAGLFYRPGTLRARTCVRGAQQMYEFAHANKIPYRRAGKLVVATEATHEQPMLQQLLERGETNGVPGLEILSPEQVEAIEPAVHSSFGAVHSPNTGIIDYAAVARTLEQHVHDSGGCVVKNFSVSSAEAVDSGVRIVGFEPGQPGPRKEIHAKGLVTAAGLYADSVAQRCGASSKSRLKPFRGRYWSVSQHAQQLYGCNTNVYPISSGGFVGVHATPTVSGEVILGPSGAPALAREGYLWRNVSMQQLLEFATDTGMWNMLWKNPSAVLTELKSDISKQAFMRDVKKLIPDFKEEHAEPSFTGVSGHYIDEQRGTPYDDFEIETQASIPAVYARHMPSPAATASFALAEEIVDRAANTFPP